mmetsp:Transcript_48177/g.71390  ORF Transcript_48177/g.71390 Transcript_48177/m.71390 type:complete len:199 (-) Transcript_48177:1686-2282(-)
MGRIFTVQAAKLPPSRRLSFDVHTCCTGHQERVTEEDGGGYVQRRKTGNVTKQQQYRCGNIRYCLATNTSATNAALQLEKSKYVREKRMGRTTARVLAGDESSLLSERRGRVGPDRSRYHRNGDADLCSRWTTGPPGSCQLERNPATSRFGRSHNTNFDNSAPNTVRNRCSHIPFPWQSTPRHSTPPRRSQRPFQSRV